MNVMLTKPNKQALSKLLKTGRWNNSSEILRYGLHLVLREVERRDLRPFTPEELAAADAAVDSDADRAEDAALRAASLRAGGTPSHRQFRQ